MSAYSFFGRGKSSPTLSGSGKCPPLFFHGGANVLPLVLGTGKCPGAIVRGEMSVYRRASTPIFCTTGRVTVPFIGNTEIFSVLVCTLF